MIIKLVSRRVWLVDRGCILLLGTWSQLRYIQGSVLAHHLFLWLVIPTCVSRLITLWYLKHFSVFWIEDQLWLGFTPLAFSKRCTLEWSVTHWRRSRNFVGLIDWIFTVSHPAQDFLLIQRWHRCQWKLQKVSICPMLRTFEQKGMFMMPKLLWHGAFTSEEPPHLVASYDTQGDANDLF
jgi:hypothetical protein